MKPAVLLPFVLLAACEPVPTTQPDIVVIVMDTVRQDHVNCYGHERPTTPFLNELATTATVFEQAYSTSGWTSPAHASLFTGLYPAAHGTTQENWSLAAEHETLAELLSEAGYYTLAIVENPMLSIRNGFNQGFARYDEMWRDTSRSPRASVERFRSALEERDAKTPFFAFINLMGGHSPYASPKEFKYEFVTDRTIGTHSNLWRDFVLGRAIFTEEELEHLRELYDGKLLFTDSLVREIYGTLEELGLSQDSVVIVTSDHGENIGDHHLMDHVFSLHESTTKIPLIVRDPFRLPQAERISEPVQLLDLFPTLLAYANCQQTSGQGRALWRPDPHRPVFCEYYFPHQAFLALGKEKAKSKLLDPYRRRIRSLRSGNHKLIWGDDGHHELYNLIKDPDELTNLIDSPEHQNERERLEALVQTQYALLSGAETSAARMLEPDTTTRRALRELGYAR